ncbi:MAG: HEAT repeat domain-containing protein [Candidatus Binatia bacterium]
MRIYTGLIIFLVSLILQMGLLGSVTQAEGPLKRLADPPLVSRERLMIKVADGVLTAEARGSPLQEVLEAITRKCGIRIFLAAPTEETVTVEFRNLPIDEGLRRILEGRSFVFLYSRASSDSKRTPIARLEEVHVLTGAGKRATPDESGTPEADMVMEHEGVFPEAKIVSKGAFGEVMDVRVKADPGESRGKSRDKEEAIEEFSQMLSAEEDRPLRKRAVETLERMWHADAIEPLTHALVEDGDPSLRETAAKALGRTWSSDAVEPLSLALLGDQDSFVREAAARALGETWREAAVGPLSQALLGDPSRYVRENAAQALAEIGGSNSVEPLIQALRDEDGSVREGAVLALGAIGGPQAADALTEASLNDNDIWVRETAAQLVEKIGK